MTDWRGIIPIVAAVPSVLVAQLLAGCRGDDNASPTSSDAATADSSLTWDASGLDAADSPFDSGADAPDSTIPSDASGDSEVTEIDASADSNSEDADSESIDANTATDADAAESADAEAAAYAAMFAFPGQVASALCERAAACCGVSVDSGAFDVSKCISIYLPLGVSGSNAGTTLLDSGVIMFDPTKAEACIENIQSIDCATNTLPEPVQQSIYLNCYGALSGTLDAGSGMRKRHSVRAGRILRPGRQWRRGSLSTSPRGGRKLR